MGLLAAVESSSVNLICQTYGVEIKELTTKLISDLPETVL